MAEELLFLEMVSAFCENLDWRIHDVQKSDDKANIKFETHIMLPNRTAGTKGARLEKCTTEGRSRMAYGEDTDSTFFHFYIPTRFTYRTQDEIPRELLVAAMNDHWLEGVCRNAIVSHNDGVAIAPCCSLYSAEIEQKIFVEACGDMIRACIRLERTCAHLP